MYFVKNKNSIHSASIEVVALVLVYKGSCTACDGSRLENELQVAAGMHVEMNIIEYSWDPAR